MENPFHILRKCIRQEFNLPNTCFKNVGPIKTPLTVYFRNAWATVVRYLLPCGHVLKSNRKFAVVMIFYFLETKKHFQSFNENVSLSFSFFSLNMSNLRLYKNHISKTAGVKYFDVSVLIKSCERNSSNDIEINGHWDNGSHVRVHILFSQILDKFLYRNLSFTAQITRNGSHMEQIQSSSQRFCFSFISMTNHNNWFMTWNISKPHNSADFC